MPWLIPLSRDRSRTSPASSERHGCSTSRSSRRASRTSVRGTALPSRTVDVDRSASSHGGAVPHDEARLPGAAAARRRPARRSSTSPGAPASTASSCGPAATATSPAGCPSCAPPPGRGGDAHGLPGHRPLHRRLRRRPAPRRDRAAAVAAQRDRRARRRGRAHPGQLGHVQPAAAAVHARRANRPKTATVLLEALVELARACGAGGRLARARAAQPLRGLHGQPRWTRPSTWPRRCDARPAPAPCGPAPTCST